jgi:2-haloalkanoic acid dehalogenase type II
MPLKALLFDLDDTLLDGSYVQTSLRRTCARLSKQVDDLDADVLMDANAGVWAEYWPEIERQWVFGGMPTEAVRTEVWSRTLRRCGCEDESLALLAARVHSELEREDYCLFDDARILLEELAGRLPLALITNGPSDLQRAKLRTIGLEDRFDSIVVSGEVGASKPDPSVFRIALDALSVTPEEAWHVGDNLATDVAGANAVGVTSIWLNRTNTRVIVEGCPHATHEIHSLNELMALIAM